MTARRRPAVDGNLHQRLLDFIDGYAAGEHVTLDAPIGDGEGSGGRRGNPSPIAGQKTGDNAYGY